MTISTILKRTTALAAALAALAALPLLPATALAESAQVTGTQPPAAEEQAAQPATPSGEQAQGATQGATTGQAGQGDAQATQTQGEAGKGGTQSGAATGEAQKAREQSQTGGATGQAAPGEAKQTDAQATQTQGESGQTGTQSGEAPAEGAEGEQAGQDGDILVAKVGNREIRRSDVLTVIGMLPPRLQQQPPEMLIPIALDQLVMRELILQKAQEAGLESDPAVTSMAEDASVRAKEDAMVQVWLEQELGKAVTDEKVQETYDSVKQQMGDQAPAMESLRPQIEQELRQQAFLDLSKELQADAEVTLYGPDGQAVTQ